MKKPETGKTYILFHYSFHNLAGTERVLSNLIEMISAMEGRLILLLASKKEKMALDLDSRKVEIYYLDCDNANSGTQLQLIRSHYQLINKLTVFLKSLSRDNNITLLATNAFLATVAYLSCRRLKLDKVKFIACEHFSLHVAGRFSKFIRKRYYPYMTVITLTERDRKEIEERYRPAACYCIPNASPFRIDTDHYNPEHKTLLAIGRFSYQKGFDLLVTAFSGIAHKYPDWELVIAGDDFGSKAQVEAMILDGGINNIRLLPATKNVAQLYKAASFFVLSSRFEGLPMVLIEAISFGLPVIAFDCPTGPREIINNTNGILVENGNVAALTESIEQLISSKERLLQKSSNAALTAEAYTRQKIDELWKDIL